MGLGDEIMALGRAERLHLETGRKVGIYRRDSKGPGVPEYPRDHDAWTGHPAIDPAATQRIIDCAADRPYIKEWQGRRVVFRHDHRPHAGRVRLADAEWDFCPVEAPYAIVAPHLKDGASPNKSWGVTRWEGVIRNFPIPVYQLEADNRAPVIAGATRVITPSFRHALAVIARASVVMCNEGGAHHMAASMRVPAVVFFGSFTPPLVTGYPFHYNMAVETPEGYCGRWDPCKHCCAARGRVSVESVRSRALLMMESYGVD